MSRSTPTTPRADTARRAPSPPASAKRREAPRHPHGPHPRQERPYTAPRPPALGSAHTARPAGESVEQATDRLWDALMRAREALRPAPNDTSPLEVQRQFAHLAIDLDRLFVELDSERARADLTPRAVQVGRHIRTSVQRLLNGHPAEGATVLREPVRVMNAAGEWAKAPVRVPMSDWDIWTCSFLIDSISAALARLGDATRAVVPPAPVTTTALAQWAQRHSTASSAAQSGGRR